MLHCRDCSQTTTWPVCMPNHDDVLTKRPHASSAGPPGLAPSILPSWCNIVLTIGRPHSTWNYGKPLPWMQRLPKQGPSGAQRDDQVRSASTRDYGKHLLGMKALLIQGYEVPMRFRFGV